ncbi:alcohol dehydrogenase catalytic domain-containing protein [Planotetraspora kaengkrachanensis]|uniref:alcohol dehydrogenase n=1 Tax=Planotetraspora kaengkrachanensis TaxID=575193 RepID=A0A8J3VAQ2_9ACTN|nr:alcohol dehydrogenase catalytic domain-containing protein [Planotetraspora kaengkrachanensis]GIG84160.1 alcohol dehydrogenase [Planotetraspora kaengkrachanensis]
MLTAIATAINEPLTFTEREVPEPGQGEVLVEITACGICYTDLDLLQGHWPIARFPVVPGHEITGVVVATGPGVSWPEVGASVGAQFLGDSCRHCDYCVRGEQILCPGKRITGIVIDGGYAEYAVLKADFVTPLPEGLDPVAAAPLMCAGVTAFNSLRRGGITAGSRVAVIGAGGVGALAIRYAVAMGARVAVIGRSNRAEAAVREMGAERFIAARDSDPAEALRAWDGGANLILNASPSTSAAAATLTGLAPDGMLVLCGYGPEPLVLPTQPMVLNRLRVMINPSGSPHDTRDALAFSAAHDILPEFTPVGLRDANAALEAMAKGQAGRRSVITFD